MITDLAIWSGAAALGFFLAVAFYESLSTRDILLTQTAELTRRITHRRSALAITDGLTVLVLIPLLVVLWAVVLEAALTIIGPSEDPRTAETAVAIVAAARLLAYIRQRTSHELAKAIPLALALSLLLGGVRRIEDNLQLLTEEPYRSDLTLTMLAFLLALESGLRLLTYLARATSVVIKKIGQPGPTSRESDRTAATPQTGNRAHRPSAQSTESVCCEPPRGDLLDETICDLVVPHEMLMKNRSS